MAAPTNEITHGTLLPTQPVDESGLLVTKVTKKFTRDKKEIKGAVTQAVAKVRCRNPLLEISIEGAVYASPTGYAVAAAGSAVSTCANFAATERTIDNAVGTRVMGDIEDTFDRDPDIDCYFTTSLSMVHYSYVV